MIDNVTPEVFGRIPHEIEAVINLFHRLAEELKSVLDDLEDLPTDKEISDRTRRLHELASALLKERQKFEELYAKYGGQVGHDILDLDAARQEVERRMAGLRRARNP